MDMQIPAKQPVYDVPDHDTKNADGQQQEKERISYNFSKCTFHKHHLNYQYTHPGIGMVALYTT